MTIIYAQNSEIPCMVTQLQKQLHPVPAAIAEHHSAGPKNNLRHRGQLPYIIRCPHHFPSWCPSLG